MSADTVTCVECGSTGVAETSGDWTAPPEGWLVGVGPEGLEYVCGPACAEYATEDALPP